MLKVPVVVYFVVSRNFHGGTEGNYRNPQSGSWPKAPKLEIRTGRIAGTLP
jgi:hypothetical protein